MIDMKQKEEIKIRFEYRGHSTDDEYDILCISIAALNLLINENFKAFRYIVDMVINENEMEVK